MAIVEGLPGIVRGKIGGTLYQHRKGQQIWKTKPHPLHLKGVKKMSDDELREWAKKHGMTFEEAKKIREKQQKIPEAIEYCNSQKEKLGEKFTEKYKPSAPGQTPFNVCVSKYLKGEEGE